MIDSKVVGENQQNADIVVSPWPSDHRAVVSTVKINPVDKPGNDKALPLDSKK